MKKHHIIIRSALAGLVCASVATIACALSSSATAAPKPAPANADEATFTVARTPSIGSGVFVNLSVDGKRVATLSQGRNYRGSFAPGKHTLSVTPDPNTSGQRASNVEVSAEKGHTYAFTASRTKSGDLALSKSN